MSLYIYVPLIIYSVLLLCLLLFRHYQWCFHKSAYRSYVPYHRLAFGNTLPAWAQSWKKQSPFSCKLDLRNILLNPSLLRFLFFHFLYSFFGSRYQNCSLNLFASPYIDSFFFSSFSASAVFQYHDAERFSKYLNTNHMTEYKLLYKYYITTDRRLNSNSVSSGFETTVIF